VALSGYTVRMIVRWPEEIYSYITEHTQFDDALLREMEKRAEGDGFPIIGPLVGPWLYFLSVVSRASRIYEMGSGYGYSTWYFARALADMGGGTVTHVVWDEELSAEARGWLERAGLLPCCEFIVSEAVLALSSEKPGFDLVFLDIDKEAYPSALEVIEQKLRPGGLLLVDNVLRSGTVVHTEGLNAASKAVCRFNDLLRDSPRWDYLINPLRDGLGVARLRE